jgi:hypothetical protein
MKELRDLTSGGPYRSFPTDETSYTGWIVGGILAFAVLMGLFFTFGSPIDQTTITANRPEPITTGSATSDVPKGPTLSPKPAPLQPADNIVPAGQSRP